MKRLTAALFVLVGASFAFAGFTLGANSGLVKPTTPFTTEKYPGPNTVQNHVIPSRLGFTRWADTIPEKPAVPASEGVPAVAAVPETLVLEYCSVPADRIVEIVRHRDRAGYSVLVLSDAREIVVVGDSATLSMAVAKLCGALHVNVTGTDQP